MLDRPQPGSTSGGADARSVAESLREYGRGMAGGLLFSLPLLYTAEVWLAGFLMPAERQLAYVVITFTLLLGYNRYAGLRRDSSWAEVAIDSVEELGLGLVLAAAILFALGRISFGQPLREMLGQVIVEAMTAAIGVSVGTAQLGGGGNGPGEMNGAAKPSENAGDDGAGASFPGQLVIAFCGAMLFAANIAPTEEIVTVGTEISAGHVVSLAVLSLVVGGGILYYSNFRGAHRWSRADNLFDIYRGTVVTYAIALVSSAVILWLFGRFEGTSLAVIAAQTVVLGFAATLGASAGRLLLQ